MLETMKLNWKQVCEQLLSVPDTATYAEEKAALLKIEKNVYHRKTASPVVIKEVHEHNTVKGHHMHRIPSHACKWLHLQLFYIYNLT